MKNLDILIKFLSYEGSITNDPLDAIKVSNRTQKENINKVSRIQDVIVDAAVDQSICLPDANTNYLLILGDYPVSLKINGGSEEISLKPLANGVKSFMFYLKGDITSLTVSNASGNDASMDFISVKG